MNEALNVVISPEVWGKVNVWVQHCDGEVSGMGKVQRKGNTLFVTEAYLLDQVSTGSETELDPSAVAKLMTETITDGGDLTWWWHSHANMDVFWSGTDHKQINELSKNNYVLATVFNKKKEMLSAYRQGGDTYLPDLFINKVETNVGVVISNEVTEQLQKLADSKVKKPAPIAREIPTSRRTYEIEDYSSFGSSFRKPPSYYGYDKESDDLLDSDKCAVPSWEKGDFTEYLQEMYFITPSEAGLTSVNKIYRGEYKTQKLKESMEVRKLKLNKTKGKGASCKK